MQMVRRWLLTAMVRRNVPPTTGESNRLARTVFVCSTARRAAVKRPGTEAAAEGPTALWMNVLIGGGLSRGTWRNTGGRCDDRRNIVDTRMDTLVIAVVIPGKPRMTMTRRAHSRSSRREAWRKMLRGAMVVTISMGRHAMHTFPVARLLMLDISLLAFNIVSIAGVTGMGSPVMSKGVIGPTRSYPSGVMEDWLPADPVRRTHVGAVSSAGRGPRALMDLAMFAVLFSISVLALMRVVLVWDPRAGSGPPNALRRCFLARATSDHVAMRTAHCEKSVRRVAVTYLQHERRTGGCYLAWGTRLRTAPGPCHGSGARTGSTSLTSTSSRG